MEHVLDVQNLLNEKELAVSDTLEDIAHSIITSIKKQDEHFSAEEARDKLMKKTDEVLSQLPIVFQNKWAHALKQFIQQMQNKVNRDQFVVVPQTKTNVIVMAGKFNRAYHAWINNRDCVSFAMPLKMKTKLSIKDLFTLHYFVFATCLRQHNDGMMGLACTGASSCGKSTIFENPLLSSAYNYCSDSGVGRFNVEDKNCIVAHDFDIDCLVHGKDAEKFRAICRAEVVKVKVHSGEKNVPAVFLFVTANQKITNHYFNDAITSLSTIPGLYSSKLSHQKTKRKNYGSDLMPPPGSKRKSKDESIVAMQKRFIEAYCRKRPEIDPNDLPEAGTIFTRWHLILGLYMPIMDILDKHPIQDFPHRMLYKYVYYALKQNEHHYCDMYNLSCEQELLLKEKLSSYKVQLNNTVSRKKETSKQYQQEMVQVANYFKKMKSSQSEEKNNISLSQYQQEGTHDGQQKPIQQ